MEDSGHLAPTTTGASAPDPFAERRRIRNYTSVVKWHRRIDGVTEGLLYAMLIFSPWAFGTTQDWAVWVMNGSGYGLGVLLAAKWLIRWKFGYQPAKWGHSTLASPHEGRCLTEIQLSRRRSNAALPEAGSQEAPNSSEFNVSHDPSTGGNGPIKGWLLEIWATRGLAILTILILAYCLISALNARAVFNEPSLGFVYRDNYIKWLPHSYDAHSTWFAFWMYLGLACFFWATRDWLLIKSRAELVLDATPDESPVDQHNLKKATLHNELHRRFQAPFQPHKHRWYIPDHLRRLLWILCVNAALVSAEATLQRLSGTDKLLWIKQPALNRLNEGQFGPYAYRSNAAQYINLVWPVCLGFWWALRRYRKSLHGPATNMGGSPHIVLLPSAGFMAAGAIISISRGGAIVSILQLIGTTFILLLANRQGSRWSIAGLIGLAVATLSFAGLVGWDALYPRFLKALEGDTSDRQEIYNRAQEMKKDFLLLGSGPGTFGSLYHLYRQKTSDHWAAYLHDDWLETQITFGQIGASLILLALILAVIPWCFRPGISLPWPIIATIWLALGGCLLHAVGDFPFQVHSVLLVFLLLCCLTSCASKCR